jgi:predicted transcriptional regulator
MGSTVIRGPSLREMAERGDDVSDVLLKYTPTWAKRATQDLYSVVGKLDEIERDSVYKFVGFESFEDYVVNGLGQAMWWVEGAREIVANDAAAEGDKAISVAEADKEIRSKREEIAARQEKAKELREEGKTQREIAEELGVSQQTVSVDLSLPEKEVITLKTGKEPRKVIGYRITQYTKPETAARRIREVFGDEFAASLAISLRPE